MSASTRTHTGTPNSKRIALDPEEYGLTVIDFITTPETDTHTHTHRHTQRHKLTPHSRTSPTLSL